MAIGVLLLAGCAGGDPWAETGEAHTGTEHQPFQILNPFEDTHPDITEDALFFLDDDIIDDLEDANEDTDLGDHQKDSKYHGDNCRFWETFDSIRRRYDGIVRYFGDGDHDGALEEFGQILHTVQDLYAHSNWVDNPEQDGLITSYHRFEFPAVSPGDPIGSPLGSMVVLQKDLPSDWTITRDPDERLPWVSTDWGEVVGLITGTHANDDGPPACPSGASIQHGDIAVLLNPALLGAMSPGAYLSKDTDLTINHDEAVALAIEATTAEFCRFARLVLLREGKPAYDTLMSSWVDDAAAYQWACGNAPSLVQGLRESSLW